jgi:hypothetical protein
MRQSKLRAGCNVSSPEGAKTVFRLYCRNLHERNAAVSEIFLMQFSIVTRTTD